jgi:hypothetical protein
MGSLSAEDRVALLLGRAVHRGEALAVEIERKQELLAAAEEALGRALERIEELERGVREPS